MDWRSLRSTTLLCALLSATLVCPALADGPSAKTTAATERGVWFSGYDAVTGSRYVYDGLVVALNGDLGKDGFAVRLFGARADWDQDPGSGRGYQADLMLGYMFSVRQLSASFFVGPDWQNIKSRPDDPTAEVRGTEFGVRVAADVSTAEKLPYYLNLSGSYSTAFNTYWTRLRLGAVRDRLTFGPEVIAMGNDSFDAQRVGAFAKFKLPIAGRSWEITISGGHQFVGGSGGGSGSEGATGQGGGEGTYGAIGFSTTF
jgi:Cellulose biosynthesis protein BcsS